MKFGRNLQRNQVPEWGDFYIAYKPLKKQIKTAVETIKAGKDQDFADFFFSLDRNLETVDAFYNKRLLEFTRRFRLLESRYSLHPPQFDPEEASELLNALLELRSSLRKLEWYAEVNCRGFTKILKKLDKKTNICAQKIYLDTKLSLKPFSAAEDAGTLKAEVNAWISKIGEDNSEIDPQGENLKLERVPSPGRNFWELPPSTVDSIDAFLRNDKMEELEALINRPEVSERITLKFKLALLQRAISNKAPKCIQSLLNRIDNLHEEDDINERNIIHRLVILVGKTAHTSQLKSGISGLTTNSGLGLKVPKPVKIFVAPAQEPVRSPLKADKEIAELNSLLSSGAGDLIIILNHVLQSIRPVQASSLSEKDTYGRMPLHYAAYYGIPAVCEALHYSMKRYGLLPEEHRLDGLFWQDSDGLAPIHLAIQNDHVKTTRTLLDGVPSTNESLHRPAVAYALAIRSDALKVLEMMLSSDININAQDENGEAALHLVARTGNVVCLRLLLKGSDAQKCNVEIVESTFGWTPLFVASAEGKEDIVDILLSSTEVDVERLDYSGWTATEHAALRGHLSIARKLKERASLVPGNSKMSSNAASGATSPRLPSTPASGSGESQSGYFSGQLNGSKNIKQTHLKSFGHRYLKDMTLVLITLGSTDTRRNLPAVILDQVPLSHAHSTLLDSALSVAVSAQNAKGEKTIIDLPVQDSLATENPISFETNDVSKVKLIFDIVPTYSGSTDKIIGRGVALLDTVKPAVSKQRVSLQGGVQVPILAVSTLEVIGCINFEFMVVTPFVHEGLCINREVTYWKELAGPRVIGHRGLGKNAPSRKSLQLGENTIQSFISAANLGASYVEFDVQLTRDHVPVIYHDFLVGETGIDAPVHALTLEQFLSMSGHGSHRDRLASLNSSSTTGSNGSESKYHSQTLRRTRSMTFHDSDKNEQQLQERMRYTRNFKMKGGFKGNTRGSSIQGPFTTLEEVFTMLPSEVGFNIELKYPMLQESEEEEMDTLGIEMNSWVDAVLQVVYDNLSKEKRDIIFSSFNPDICLLLSFKQPSIPILFLTEGGTAKMADVRASCLQEAIRFASRWNLLGIVSAAEPFVLCPRLVRVVKECGLVCVTYGTMNNVTANVRLQVEQGVDAVIVDSVLEIRKGLTLAGVA